MESICGEVHMQVPTMSQAPKSGKDRGVNVGVIRIVKFGV
jgi:hypothetical protein